MRERVGRDGVCGCSLGEPLKYQGTRLCFHDKPL